MKKYRFLIISAVLIAAFVYMTTKLPFVRRFGDFAPPEETYRGYAHNSYLQIWAETGIFGAVFFMIPLAVILWRKAPRRGTGPPLSAGSALWTGLLAFLIQAFFDTNFHALQTSLLFWIFWGAFQRSDAPA